MAFLTPHRGLTRQEILQRVYEDNLRTQGDTYEPPAELKRPAIPPPKQIHIGTGSLTLLGVLVVLVALIVAPGSPLLKIGRSTPDAAADTGPFDPSYGTMGSTFPTASLLEDQGAVLPETASFDRVLNNPEMSLANLFDLSVRTIVLDAGHGGIDAGAVGHLGSQEKDITLDVTQRLKRRLERHGYRVLMTRNSDHKVDLKDRVAFANERKADLFLSVHVNYLPVEPVTLIETYYFGPQSDAAALALAEKENTGSQLTVAEFDAIIQRLGVTLKLQESKSLAASIQTSLMRSVRRSGARSIDAGIKTAPFVVLLGVEAPSILAEIACLSNRVEEIRLNTPAYREQLAASLEEGVVRYLQQRNRKNELTPKANAYAVTQKQVQR